MPDLDKQTRGRGLLEVLLGFFLVGVMARGVSKPPGRAAGPTVAPAADLTADADTDIEPAKKPSGIVAKLDGWQQRHIIVAFPIAVVKKFGDDRAGRLAALVAYYGFFSLFPLLLVAVTVIAYIFGNDDAQRLKDSALSQIPVLGEQLNSQINGLSGSGIALLIGVLTALWAGLGCMQAAQDAMNEIWDVPRLEQPTFVKKRLRSVGALVVVAVSLGVGTVAAQLTARLPELPGSGRVVGVLVTVAINVGVFWVSYKVLTAHHRSWKTLLPGAVVAGIGYTVLQFVGSWYVNRTIKGASDTYGTFAVVIGLLGWLYLLGQLAIYAAEVNVVKAGRLWPRSLVVAGPPTSADETVVAAAAEATRQRPDTRITVRTGRKGRRHRSKA